MKIGMRRLRFFILLFAASSLLFQLPSGAFAATLSDITARDAETDGVNGFDVLGGAINVKTFVIGDSTYAIVTAWTDDGVQIIDISDPTDIVAKGSMVDTGSLELDGARGVDVFTIGSSTYAIVAAWTDNGVQVIDISDPENIVATDSLADNGSLALKVSRNVETFTIDSSTYAIVTSNVDDGVQIIDISDPENIEAKGSMVDTDGTLKLDGARDVATFVIGSSTYAIVTSQNEGGVQIIDISDVDNLVAKGSMADAGSVMLDDTRGIDVFTISSSTCALGAA